MILPRDPALGQRPGPFDNLACVLGLLVLLAGSLGPCSMRSVAQETEGLALPLFREDISGVGPKPAARVRGIRRYRHVSLNPEVASLTSQIPRAAGTTLKLNLFPDARFDLSVQRRQSLTGGGLVCYGRIAGIEGSQAILVSEKGVVAGSIFVPGRGAFKITYTGNGVHQVAELEPDELPTCAVRWPARDAKVLPPNPSNRECLRTSTIVSDRAPSDAVSSTNALPVTINLMVAYTAQARDGAGGTEGMNTLIDLAVAEANACYLNSNIHMQLHLVYRGLVDYAETGVISTELDRLGNPADGYLDEVNALRSQFRADLVSLVVETETSGNYSGVAFTMSPPSTNFASHAFSVVRRAYLIGNYSLAHELGHNMGCLHDRENASGPGAFPYSYGYRFSANGVVYRTVMAYPHALQVPNFSNPNVSFLGAPTGVADDDPLAADNARTMNNTVALVASFQPRSARLEFVAPSVTQSSAAGAATIGIERTDVTTNTVTVDYATSDGTALAGLDYTSQSGTITFAPGETLKTITVPLANPARSEAVRELNLQLSGPTGDSFLGSQSTCVLSILPTLSQTPGNLDLSFDPGFGANYEVSALALQTDGAVVIGGGFSAVNGAVRNRLARLQPDGSVDATYASGLGARFRILALVLQPDQKALIGGEFNGVSGTIRNHVARVDTAGFNDSQFDPGSGANDFVWAVALATNTTPAGVYIGGQFVSVNGTDRQRVARLNLDGSLDPSFNPGSGPNEAVQAMVVDGDGKVLIGGLFTSVGNTARHRIARLNPDGSLDASFDPGTGADDVVQTIALQPDGKVLLGGNFRSIQGQPRNRIARLNADGSLDLSFDPGGGADNSVSCLLAGGDGEIYIGGAFSTYNSTPRNYLARLHADGSLDATFNAGPGPNDSVLSMAAQSDGKLIIGGLFTMVDGVPRHSIARLETSNSPPVDPARFTHVSILPDGQVALTVTGPFAPAVQLEASTNLQDWLPLAPIPPSASFWLFTDPESRNFQMRFYRVRSDGQEINASSNR